MYTSPSTKRYYDKKIIKLYIRYWINKGRLALFYKVLVQTLDPQTSDGTKVGQYKGRSVQMLDLQTSDWHKRRTGTNVGLLQKLDWYKRQTCTHVEPIQTSDVYNYKEKRWT